MTASRRDSMGDLNCLLSKLQSGEAAGEMEKTARALASSALEKAGAVSREEFDARCEMLARIAEQLQAMEKRIARLETQKPPAAKRK